MVLLSYSILLLQVFQVFELNVEQTISVQKICRIFSHHDSFNDSGAIFSTSDALPTVHSEGRPGHLRRVKVSILRVFPETRLVALPGHIITFMVASPGIRVVICIEELGHCLRALYPSPTACVAQA